MTDQQATTDDRAELERRILADRFEAVDAPIGWRCRGCGAEVRDTANSAALAGSSTVARLAESAADHALFCGRCDD